MGLETCFRFYYGHLPNLWQNEATLLDSIFVSWKLWMVAIRYLGLQSELSNVYKDSDKCQHFILQCYRWRHHGQKFLIEHNQKLRRCWWFKSGIWLWQNSNKRINLFELDIIKFCHFLLFWWLSYRSFGLKPQSFHNFFFSSYSYFYCWTYHYREQHRKFNYFTST